MGFELPAEEAFNSPARLSRIAMQRGSGPVYYGDEEKMSVCFYYDPILNGFLTEQKGCPQYDQKLMIRMQAFGSKDYLVKEVTEREKKRFPKAWSAFEGGENKPPDGTLLEGWAPMTMSQVAECYHSLIYTVEQLSQLPDAAVERMGMGYKDLRKKAKSWLKQAEDGKEVIRLAGLTDRLEKELSARDELIEQMSARIDALEDKKAK